MSAKKYSDVKTHEIEELQFEIQKATKLIESIVQHDDAVILVGNTKAGKSTLINYFMGNKLKTVETKKHKFNLVKVDNSFGPGISINTASATDQPERFKSEILNLVFYDIPGFSDNSSKWREIKHSVYICELLKRLASAKIILIISWDDLVNDDISSLLRSFSGLENLFGDKLKNCFAGIGLFVSKVDSTEPIGNTKISELLRAQLLSSEQLNLSSAVKDFIEYLASNTQKIGIFKRPCSEIVETDNTKARNISSIASVYCISEDILKVLSPNISEVSTVFLFKLREKLFDQDKFFQMQQLVCDFLKKIYTPEKDVATLTIGEAKAFFENSTILNNKIEEYFSNWPTYCDKINAVKKFDKSISHFIDENDLYKKMKCIEIIDRLLKNDESKYLDIGLKRIFAEAKNKIENNLVAVNIRIGNITEEQARQKFEIILKNYEEDIRKVKEDLESLQKRARERRRRRAKDEIAIGPVPIFTYKF